MSKTMVGTTGPKENFPIAVHVRPNGNIEAFFMANWIVNVVVEPRHGKLVEKNIGIDQPGFLWLLDAARAYIQDRQLPQPKGEPMSAKVVVTRREAPPKRTYPWVGINGDGVIVWFNTPTSGVVIGRDEEIGSKVFACNLGSCLHTWEAAAFKEFTGTVTISN